jgi:hypothetical protein
MIIPCEMWDNSVIDNNLNDPIIWAADQVSRDLTSSEVLEDNLQQVQQYLAGKICVRNYLSIYYLSYLIFFFLY